jgi:hypothetical protein
MVLMILAVCGSIRSCCKKITKNNMTIGGREVKNEVGLDQQPVETLFGQEAVLGVRGELFSRALNFVLKARRVASSESGVKLGGPIPITFDPGNRLVAIHCATKGITDNDTKALRDAGYVFADRPSQGDDIPNCTFYVPVDKFDAMVGVTVVDISAQVVVEPFVEDGFSAGVTVMTDRVGESLQRAVENGELY